MEKPEHCPCCGAEAGITVTPGREHLTSHYFGVMCKGCYLNAPMIYHTPTEAVNAWNRRQTDERII